MKYRVICLFMLFLLSLSVKGQVQHAQTTEQCRADEHLWTSQLIEYYKAETETMKNRSPNRSDLVNVSFKELAGRSVEMGTCAAVDPSYTERYSDAGTGLQAVIADRFAHFLERHNLMNQFLDEDAAGKR